MTTANELYAMEPMRTTSDVSLIKDWYCINHIPEISDGTWVDDVNAVNTRIQIRVLKEHSFDYRRFWRLCTVWFDDKPVVIIQNAGREGSDHVERFITDGHLFAEMIHYIRTTLIQYEEDGITIVINPDDDRNDLDDFYGNHLSGIFERH